MDRSCRASHWQRPAVRSLPAIGRASATHPDPRISRWQLPCVQSQHVARKCRRGHCPTWCQRDLASQSTIRLAGDLRLALKIDRRPASAAPRFTPRRQLCRRCPAAERGHSGNHNGRRREAQEELSKSLIQLAVIGFCVLAMVGLLMMRNGGGEPAAAPDMPSFSELVNESLTKDETRRAIIRRLQYAQAAFIRGNSELARERFLKLRDTSSATCQLSQRQETSDTQRILSYVEYRLGQI